MRMKIGPALCIATLVPVIASAQEAGQAGVSMGYPGAIGFVYQVSDAIAVRPDVSFTRTTTSSSPTFSASEASTWTTNVGASALFYFAKHDNVRPYFSPRLGYARARSAFASNSPVSGASTTAISRGNLYTGSGSFGAQYTPARRFGIFGEVGFAYTHGTTRSGVSSSEVTTKNWATRAGVGAIFYF